MHFSTYFLVNFTNLLPISYETLFSFSYTEKKENPMNYQCVIINKDLTENVDERIILENEKMVQKGYTLVTTTFQEPSKILMIYKSE